MGKRSVILGVVSDGYALRLGYTAARADRPIDHRSSFITSLLSAYGPASWALFANTCELFKHLLRSRLLCCKICSFELLNITQD